MKVGQKGSTLLKFDKREYLLINMAIVYCDNPDYKLTVNSFCKKVAVEKATELLKESGSYESVMNLINGVGEVTQLQASEPSQPDESSAHDPILEEILKDEE